MSAMSAPDALSALYERQSRDCEPTRDEYGVDVTLIDELLRLDPVERLRLNDRAVNAILELRRAFNTR